MEQMFAKMEHIDPNFRLFITCLPHKDFPLGLLQMSTKVTNEPPMGLKAGLLRTYTVTVDQERLERVETEQWRKLLFGLSFLHSVVQERRKFGAIGADSASVFNFNVASTASPRRRATSTQSTGPCESLFATASVPRRLVHQVRVQHRGLDGLHPVPGRASLCGPDILEHAPVHGQ